MTASHRLADKSMPRGSHSLHLNINLCREHIEVPVVPSWGMGKRCL